MRFFCFAECVRKGALEPANPARVSPVPRARICAALRAACLLAALMGTAAALPAQAPCTPPDAMKPELQGTPTAEALNKLGVWFAGQTQYACAANAFAASLQSAPDQKDLAHIAFMFGVSLYLAGDTKEAISALQEAEQLGYRNLQLHVILATIFDLQQATQDALPEWRAALDLEPESTRVLDGLSNDLLLEKDWAGTIAVLESPRALPQRTAAQCLTLATAYTQSRKLDKALSVLRDGFNTSPDSVPLANRLADLLVQMRQPKEAVTVLEVAAARHPGDAAEKARLQQALETLSEGR